MTDQTPDVGRRRRLLLAGGAGAVVAVGLALALTSGGDDPTGGAEASPSPGVTSTPSLSPTAPGEASATDAPSDAGAVPSPDAEATPGGVVPAAPGEPVAPSPTDRPDGRAEATVPLEQPVELRSGVTARISQVERVDAVSTLPGEVGGPGLRVTVEVRNDTDAPVELSSAVINAYVGPDAVPATSTVEPGSQPFPAAVQPGQSATARAVFTIPEADRGDVRFELDLSVDDVVVLFAGDAAEA